LHDSFLTGLDYEMTFCLLGKGLITSDGELWKTMRRAIRPAFFKEQVFGAARSTSIGTTHALASLKSRVCSNLCISPLCQLLRLNWTLPLEGSLTQLRWTRTACALLEYWGLQREC
jgi:hypothetical protein